MTPTPATQTPTLAEWLEQRLDEDEAVARAAADDDYMVDGGLRYGEVGYEMLPDLTIDPARVLAEVAAKRAALALHVPGPDYGPPGSCVLCQWDVDCDAPKHDYQRGAGEWPCDTLRHLASAYADHPEFRDEWRP